MKFTKAELSGKVGSMRQRIPLPSMPGPKSLCGGMAGT